MKEFALFMAIIGIPFIAGAIPGYLLGYKRGDNMVLDRLQPLFRRTAFRLSDAVKRLEREQ